MNGELEAVKDALLQITSRLQHHFFRDAYPSLSYPNTAFSDQPPFRSYSRRDFSPPRMHSNFGPSFHKFDAVGGLPTHSGFHPLHLSERRPWGSQVYSFYSDNLPLSSARQNQPWFVHFFCFFFFLENFSLLPCNIHSLAQSYTCAFNLVNLVLELFPASQGIADTSSLDPNFLLMWIAEWTKND